MNISHYLDQLLEDIEALMQRKPPCEGRVLLEDGSEVFSEEHMLDINEDVLEENGILLSEYTGISLEQLPGSGMLTDDLVELLYSGIINLLNHYQFYPEFHESVPTRLCYGKLREEWEGIKIPKLEFEIHDVFCSYDVSDCPFPGVCKGCLENDENYVELMAELEREAEEERREMELEEERDEDES